MHSIFLEVSSDNVQDGDVADEIEDNELTEDSTSIDGFPSECARQLPNHLRCASHTLNLVATTDTIKAIDRSFDLKKAHANAMAKCTKLWKSLRSPKTNEVLKDYLGIALKRPVVTRWNSLFDAIQQLVKCKNLILQYRSADANLAVLKNAFLATDFEYLEEYLRCTRDLAEAIDTLQGESYCYYGYLWPTLMHLRRKMVLLESSDDIYICRPILRATV